VDPIKDADIRQVARKHNYAIKTLEGVLYRCDRASWAIMADRVTRSGPFYRVLGAVSTAKAMKKLRLRWGRFEAVTYRGTGIGRHNLYILKADARPSTGHEQTIAAAKGSEAFALGGSGGLLVR
jgi:hypothetical protein